MRRALLLSFVAIVAAGCPRPQYPECKTDPDCAGHAEVCINGFCKECRDDSNCAARPDRPICRDAICVASPQCSRNEDCGQGMKCEQGRCVAECAADADCGAGGRCAQGRCVRDEPCAADADCPPGKACVDRVCRAQDGLSRRAIGVCDLKPIYFGFDDATLSPQARKALDDAFPCMQREKVRRLVIAGHTDERGTTEYNLALGERRAEAVRKYLAQLGIEPPKLKAISYGKERPADPGHDDAAWAKNRRVEIAPEP
jgi:peptidoglycan-associated lipoprotein